MEFNYNLDKSSMGLMISKLPQQCREGLSLAKDIKIDTKIRNIVIAGMGGSGIAGQILKSYLGDKIPVHIVQDFSVPEFVDAYSWCFVFLILETQLKHYLRSELL